MKPNKIPKPPRTTGSRTLDLRNRIEPGNHSAPKLDRSTLATKPIREPKSGISRKRRVLLSILAILLAVVAAYIAWLMLAPKLKKPAKEITTAIEEIKKTDQNTIFIPTAGVYAPVLEGGIEQLDKGLWHRYPERGNPEMGGNFVVTGHSFVWAFLPKQVAEKSVFYNLGEVKVGDEIMAYWNKQFYYYKVVEAKTVKPNEISVENKTKDPTLTVYTCTTAGSPDGRVVIIARPR